MSLPTSANLKRGGTMTDRELMLALQCCAPRNKNDRNCWDCPFYNNPDCHTSLCENVIDYILKEQGKNERYHADVEHAYAVLTALHDTWC